MLRILATSRLVVTLSVATALLVGPPQLSASCAEIEGFDQIAEKGTVLFLGEIHGTVESPAFVAHLLCHAAEAEMVVTLALELPRSETESVTRYLSSNGSLADRSELLAGPVWEASFQNGLTSEAIVDLIETVRILRLEGAQIDVIFNRPSYSLYDSERSRQKAMSLQEAKKAKSPDLLVVLTSIRESRLLEGSAFDPDYRSSAYLVASWYSDWNVVSLSLSHAGGAAWVCTSGHAIDCRPLGLTGEGSGAVNSVRLIGDLGKTGHHGVYYVGELTVSPPAYGDPAAIPMPTEPVIEMPLEPEPN